MSVVNDVLHSAARRIGYYAPDDENPGSESGRYLAKKMNQAWLAGNSWDVWWCMCFVSMCLDEHGQADAIGGLSFNTDWTVNAVRRHPEAGFVSVYDAQPGDVVIFDWGGDGPTDHVGFVEKNLGGGVLQTIEGNTSPSNAGSQSAGNGVWRRVRSHSIAYVIRPAYSESYTAPVNTVDKWTPKLLDEDGIWGIETNCAFQFINSVHTDGVISSQEVDNAEYFPAVTNWEWTTDPEGSITIAKMQRAFGIDEDGIAGAQFARRLQGYYKIQPVDGYIGEKSVKVVQQAINRHLIRMGIK